jgi:pyrroline-5-carboxylate reductase
MPSKHRVGVLGAGKMGGALIAGLKESPLSFDVWAAVRTEESRERVDTHLGITVVTDYLPLIHDTDVVLLCVRPTQIIGVCEAIRSSERLRQETTVISIAAGVSVTALENALKTTNPVIRAMPNSLSRFRLGMTILGRGKHVSADHWNLATTIFSAVGDWIELPESQFDAATSVSASGPAFAYLIFEALIDGGVSAGLPRAVARDLVLKCMKNSAETVLLSGSHPAALRDEITTPAGCTIAGVMSLEESGLRAALGVAVSKTAAVAKQLGEKSR